MQIQEKTWDEAKRVAEMVSQNKADSVVYSSQLFQSPVFKTSKS